MEWKKESRSNTEYGMNCFRGLGDGGGGGREGNTQQKIHSIARPLKKPKYVDGITNSNDPKWQISALILQMVF